MDSDVDEQKMAFQPNRSESEQREIDEFEAEERRILSQDSQTSAGLAFAIPGRWTAGKREVSF